MHEEIGFLGLGALGSPMAANLLHSGYSVAVYNRTASKAEPLARQGARVAANPQDAVTSSGTVISILWDDQAIEDLVRRDGFLDRLGSGGVHIAMHTGSPERARQLAALHAEHGCTYVAAPVFGRPEAAMARQLWMPLSGPQAAKQRVLPILTAMGAQEIFDFGEEPGAATMAKLVGNFLIIAAARSMAEAFAVSEANGINNAVLAAMLTKTLFPSPVYQRFGRMLAEKAPLFQQSRIPEKDTCLLLSSARHAGLPMPIGETLLEAMAGKP